MYHSFFGLLTKRRKIFDWMQEQLTDLFEKGLGRIVVRPSIWVDTIFTLLPFSKCMNLFLFFCFLRPKRKPNKAPRCPKGLWVFCSWGEQWKNPLEPPVALKLSYELTGKYWLRPQIDNMTFFVIGYLNELLIIIFFFLLSKGEMYIITVVYVTQSERQEAQVACPVLIPELEQGRLILCLHLWMAIQFAAGCFFFLVGPFSIILIAPLTFVTLSPRVQPSQRPASPLRARLYCVPVSVPLHGLLLQPAAPCLLPPHGWWVAFCLLHWHFHISLDLF